METEEVGLVDLNQRSAAGLRQVMPGGGDGSGIDVRAINLGCARGSSFPELALQLGFDVLEARRPEAPQLVVGAEAEEPDGL